MVGKRIAVLLLALVLMGCGQSSELISIGITQIIDHPALDASRQGFIDGLASEGFVEGRNIDISYQSAQGELANAHVIAQNFVSRKKDMILAISTPSAQMAFQATKEIPIMITAVTDPVEAGLVNSWSESGTNVAGTSDSTPLLSQFALIKQLIPDARFVGIIYNTSEVNSEVQVARAKELAGEFDLEIITAGVTDINDIQIVLEALLPKVDVLHTPTDNLVVSSIGLITETAIRHQVPVMGSEEAQVFAGALATQGIDYYQLGFETGQMAAKVLQGQDPASMEIKLLETTKLVINPVTAERLGIAIPLELADQAEFVGDEQ